MSTATESKPCAMVDAWTHMDDVQFGNIPDGDREQTVFYFPRHKQMIQYEAKLVARRIAAAPALLEALELVLDSLGALSNPTELHGRGLTDEQQERILRAIRLAKGE